jgi:hypothetical protein
LAQKSAESPVETREEIASLPFRHGGFAACRPGFLHGTTGRDDISPGPVRWQADTPWDLGDRINGKDQSGASTSRLENSA